ncbi:2-hydroxyacid dehydrogenase [Candidatus Bathyarchaeota archaeon]|nr:2-hydroxyacid dehydrogenase [Candidatus Bathyarchaeota archaeon]
MKILIAGDDFIPAALFQKCLEECLGKIAKDLEFCTFDIGLEGRPRKKLPDVNEYWGRPQDLIKRIKDVEILIVSFAPVTKQVIAAGKRLRLIGCSRGGPVNVNIEAATNRGIPVLNTPGRNADAVADFTFGLILALVRNIPKAEFFVRSGRWKSPKEDTFEKPTGPELTGRTIGIIGFGEVGSRVGMRATGFKMNILVYDPYIPREKVESIGGKIVDLKTLLSESDIVTLHLRLPAGVKGFIGAEQLSWMKKTAYLINTSRGAAIDEKALYNALKKKQIAGAALDVYEKEPISSNNPLLKLDNIILTPHVAGISTDVPVRSCRMLAEDIKRFLKGEKPQHVVNPSVLEKL